MTVSIINPDALRSPGSVTVGDIDGSPLATNVSVIKFTNGAVVDDGAGQVTVSTTVGAGGGDVTGPASSIDGEVALFSGTGGKTLKRSTLTGIMKHTAGVATVANPGTDYLLPSGDGSALTSITKTQIGLGNVDNTSDANKPVSSATTTQLNLKAPLASPAFTGNITYTPIETENFVIDGRTHPRTSLTNGVLRIEHTAGVQGTRPLAIDVDCNGFPNTHCITLNMTATGIAEGSENHGIDFSIDVDNSTGGEIAAVSVSKSGPGAATVTALEVYPGCAVVEHYMGTTIVADSNFIFSGAAYTDRTAAFDSGSTNVQIFVANTDYIYIGHSVKFSVIDVDLAVFASGAGIVPTFEYSDSINSWATFAPGDTTNGFRQNGTIAMPELINWTTRTVNNVTGKFWVRIRRTGATLATPPTETTIKVIITDKCIWDASGMLDISKITLRNLPTYTTRANAIAGGLTSGQVFRDTNYSLWIV